MSYFRSVRAVPITVACLVLFVVPLGLWSQAGNDTILNGYEIVLETDSSGEIVQGSVVSLIDHVERGTPVRVGWELNFQLPNTEKPNRLVHWVDAGFLTIWKGHVFAQIRSIYTQGPVMDRAAIILGKEPDGWVAILGSDGSLLDAFSGNDSQKQVVPMRWAVAK